jgi:hypothetical protein
MFMQNPSAAVIHQKASARGSYMPVDAIEVAVTFILSNVQDVAFGDRVIKLHQDGKVVDEIMVPKWQLLKSAQCLFEEYATEC